MAYAAPPGMAPPFAPPPPAYDPGPDTHGVQQLWIAALLGLLVQALFWVGALLFYLIFQALNSAVSSVGTGSSSLPGWITPSTFYAAVGLIAGGLVLGIVSYIFFYLGFRAIRRGAPDFGAPTTLVVIGLVGFLMVVLGIVVIVGTFVSAINTASSGGVTPGSSPLDLGAILGGFALVGLGAILSLIGVIGLVLGNWRAGNRYGEGTLKAGAILTILPFVSIVGYLLLLLGYGKAAAKIRSGWAPTPSMGWVGSGPRLPEPGWGPGTPPPPPPPPPR